VITALESEGSAQWTYSRDGKKTTGMPYWRLPDAALDDPDVACDWARRALAVL
jgi:DNA transformation protein